MSLITVIIVADAAGVPISTVATAQTLTADANRSSQNGGPLPAVDRTGGKRPSVLVLTLREAIQAALERSDMVRVLQGSIRLASDSIYDAMIAEWETRAAEGRFQPSIRARVEGSRVNEPPNAFFGPGLAAPTRRDTLDLSLRLTKPLRTGGELSMGIEPPLAYLYFPNGVDPGEFNPAWSSAYVFRFRHPLLRGAGKNVATAPIQIAQTRTGQSHWAVRQQLNGLIRSVIEAYWNLYAAYVEQQTLEAVIPMAEESVRIEKLRFQAEQTIYADVARAEYQLENLRMNAVRARAEIRRRTLQLKQLVGGARRMEPLLFPRDIPLQTPPDPDAQHLVLTALQQRPELNQLRDVVRQREVELTVARNRVLPQMDLLADYRSNGLQERFDTSLAQTQRFDYTTWTLGLRMDVPLGNLTARSRRHAAEVRLARDRRRLQAQEEVVTFEILRLHSDLRAAWERFRIASRQAASAQQWLRLTRIRYENPPPRNSDRNWMLVELADFQRAMTAWVDAVRTSGEAIARYNVLQARIDEAAGTGLARWATFREPETADAAAGPILSGRYGHALPAPARQ